MNSNGNGSGISNTGSNPWRSSFPGGVFAYGCPPIDVAPRNPFDIPPVTPSPPVTPFPPIVPNNPFDLSPWKPEIWALTVCAKCQRHVRTGEPCPWCLRIELDALKIALGVQSGDGGKTVEEIAAMRGALQRAVDTLREVSRVLGSSKLDEVIAECEKVLMPK